MAIRETLAKQSTVAVGGFAVLTVAVLAWSIMRTKSSVPAPPRAAFTTDDGHTLIYDSAARPAPFDVDGKPAVRVHLFRSGEGPPFAGWLERYTPRALPVVRRTSVAAPHSPESIMTPDEIQAVVDGREYKMPGDPTWKPFHPMDVANIVQDVGKRAGSGQPVSSCDE